MRLVLGLPLLLLAYLQGPDELPSLRDPATATEVSAAAAVQAAPVPAGQQVLYYSVLIENTRGGMVRVIDPPAQFLLSRPGLDLGTVERPAKRAVLSTKPQLTAARPQSVALSGVDRVELNLGQTTDGALGVTLFPREGSFAGGEVDEALGIRDDAIYLSLAGGFGIFGGAFPLIPGNPVTLHRAAGGVNLSVAQPELLPGDILVIEVRGPKAWPLALTVENRANGVAGLSWPDGRPGAFATVVSPARQLAVMPGATLCLPGGIARAGSCGIHLNLLRLGDGAGLGLVCSGLMLDASAPPEDERGAYLELSARGGDALAGTAPLGEGYLYPQSGREPPARLPQLQLSVQLSGAETWLTLTGILGAEELSRISGLRLDWVIGETAPELNPLVPIAPEEVGPADLPSFRR